MQRFGMNAQMSRVKERAVPHWLTGKAIVFFFIAMLACWGAFGYVPKFALWVVAALSVVIFFYGGQALSKIWESKKEKIFVRNVFITGLIIRLLWVLYCYFIFNPEHYGTVKGSLEDVEGYIPFGEDIAQWIRDGFNESFSYLKDNKWVAAIDDIGYPMWLGLVYLLTGSSSDVFIPFLVKSVIGAYCIICIYHIAKRHFGEGTARIAAIFICLNPNMIYWCGSMMKEAEMVFLCCLAIDQVDKAVNAKNKLSILSLLPGLLAGMSLFFFRTALGMIFFLSVLAHLVMASHKVIAMGKKIIAGICVAITLMIGAGDSLRSSIEKVVDTAQNATAGGQDADAEWRANRVDTEGRKQSFARYAGAAVFAPLIFTIPFPTFNEASVMQIVQVQLAGGSYIKNILSFFVILVMMMFLISGEWRRHVFIIAYTLGYLMCLVLSTFAQSGRFHMPVWPMLMLFGAYGIQVAKTNGRVRGWFPMVLVIEVVACLAWNWFKLKGRGMI